MPFMVHKTPNISSKWPLLEQAAPRNRSQWHMQSFLGGQWRARINYTSRETYHCKVSLFKKINWGYLEIMISQQEHIIRDNQMLPGISRIGYECVAAGDAIQNLDAQKCARNNSLVIFNKTTFTNNQQTHSTNYQWSICVDYFNRTKRQKQNNYTDFKKNCSTQNKEFEPSILTCEFTMNSQQNSPWKNTRKKSSVHRCFRRSLGSPGIAEAPIKMASEDKLQRPMAVENSDPKASTTSSKAGREVK